MDKFEQVFDNVCMSGSIYLAIDLKSFYASAECVARGLDPLDTNLVVADVTRTSKTICLAVSPTLKAMGISGRPRLFEVEQRIAHINEERRLHTAKRHCNGSTVFASQLAASSTLAVDYITAKPRMAYYLDISARIYGIYLKYAAQEDIHVYSIDEVFIDATRYLKFYGGDAHEMARTIIADIYKQTGITATAGIGTNLYLAKVSMDIMAKHVPAGSDGVRVAYLDEMEYRRSLWSHRPLTDFWRIGRGTAKKLERHGLLTMGDIARCSLGNSSSYYNEDLLYRMFGVNAELLIDHAWGWEPCTISDIKMYKPEHSSVSSGQVLHEAYDWKHARIVVCEMAEELALDLMKRDVTTDQVALSIGYDASSLERSQGEDYQGPVSYDRFGRQRPKSVHGSLNLEHQTALTSIIRESMGSLYDSLVDTRLLVRRITVAATRVQSSSDAAPVTYEQPDLFSTVETPELVADQQQEHERKEIVVEKTLLQVKQKFGGNAVLKGLNLEEGATGRQRNKQIGGHAA